MFKKLGILILVLAALSIAMPALAAPMEPSGKFPVEITSNKLTNDPQAQYVEFSGNVKVVYDDTTITSNTLRIFYHQKPGEDDPLAVEGIKSFSAIGNVDINSPDYKIKADRADYDIDSATAVFTGKNVTVTQDKNMINGQKITINRNTGAIKVDGDSGGRIRAIFYTNEKLDGGLQ